MSQPKKRTWLNIINLLLCIVLLLFHYNSFVSIRIGNANPMIPLAFLISVCFFCSETTSCLAGLSIGLFIDSTAATKGFFNTVAFFLIAFAVSLTVRYLFNNNIRACAVISAIASVLYFIARWLFTYAFFGALGDTLQYIFAYAFPSAIYTIAITIPLYYLQKFLFARLG